MSLVTPERWYVLFWLTVGAVALAPIYYGLWRLVRAADVITMFLRGYR